MTVQVAQAGRVATDNSTGFNRDARDSNAIVWANTENAVRAIRELNQILLAMESTRKSHKIAGGVK